MRRPWLFKYVSKGTFEKVYWLGREKFSTFKFTNADSGVVCERVELNLLVFCMLVCILCIP